MFHVYPVPCLKAFSMKGIRSIGSIVKGSTPGLRDTWSRTFSPTPQLLEIDI